MHINHPPDQGPTSAPYPQLAMGPNRAKLLVVDDQPINIQVMHQLFGADCQVFMATNGARALSVCKDKRPDLVLLDVVMPDMDGFEVCRRLKADHTLCHIPVVFLTAKSDAHEVDRAIRAGAAGCVAKPFDPLKLAEQISEIAGGGRSH